MFKFVTMIWIFIIGFAFLLRGAYLFLKSLYLVVSAKYYLNLKDEEKLEEKYLELESKSKAYKNYCDTADKDIEEVLNN